MILFWAIVLFLAVALALSMLHEDWEDIEMNATKDGWQ